GWGIGCPFFGPTTLTPSRAHRIRIELGGDTYRFAFAPTNASCFGGFGTATATFTALPGTNGTLVPDGDPSVAFNTSSDQPSTKRLDGSIRGYTYDGNGDLAGTTDFDGGKTIYTYDDDHLVTGIYSPSGRAVARNIYDADGRLIGIVDADNNQISFDHQLGTE